ncbi:translation initiation factor IF-2 N-terminal domain-containing protein [Corynebacterium variabile]|uniref:translation initiation factor IF-2 N-terminal domain-containing protein n=1 Tax=Corynebacterium variabile TaxID=1727 RepID=UPI0028AA1FD3|nr:translation initiation factor IF-2 N-terminal domain-containing protein [Corynebacterium variabile]
MAKTSQELAAAAAGITIEDMGEKVRVHALAKALDVPSAELVQVLTAQGIEGKRATSTLPKAEVGEFLTALTAAGAPAETAKKAPAKRTRKAAPKKSAATKSTAKKAPATKTATKDVPAEDAPVDATAAEKNTDAPAETAKKAPAKRTRKTTAKKAAPKKDESQQPEATTAEPKKSRARKAPAKKTATTQTAAKKEEPTTPETPEVAEPSAEEKSTTKTTSRRPRRGRKATAAAKAVATEDKSDQADKAEKAEPSVQPTAATTESSADTVDELIDRIAGSVEAPEDAPKAEKKAARKTETAQATPAPEAESPRPVRRRVVRRVGSRSAASDAELLRSRKAEQRRAAEAVEQTTGNTDQQAEQAGDSGSSENSRDNRASSQDSGNRSQRRGRRGRGRGRGDQDRQNQSDNRNEEVTQASETSETVDRAPEAPEAPLEPADDHGVSGDLPVLTEGADVVDEPVKLRGSTRLESKKRWRQEQGHDKKKVVSKAEFLARRENVDRSMVVRDSERSDHPGTTTQVGITEDGMLVEHFVTSDTQSSIIGNIYLGRVQNVLSSMEAAFVDIGTGRNAVLYAGEVDWRNKHLHTRTRRIEAALKPGDQVLVQAIKDPLGHKGARLTNRLSFAGRYLVYVPGGKTQGISRKLPESERKRLKDILGRVVPDNGGTIIRTAAEGVSEELIAEDVNRLHQRWLDIQDAEEKARARKGSHPVTMYEEPNMLVKVIRDIFNEDFNELVVDGEKSWAVVRDYVHRIAPDLESRVVRYHPEQHGGRDVFEDRQLDEQLAKALSRKVWLPSGGYLIIDRTEAMTVIDVNTGSFVGSGGNLEETVTLNNLEAAEEIVRQMRLRDMGGMIVVDFIDMVLPENRDLMLRRLSEFLGRDRTRHKVSEVTSLGLVQMTRKRLGTGLLETFSTECPTCEGRGVIIHDDPVEHVEEEDGHHHERRDHGHRSEKRQARDQQETRRRHEKNREDATSDHPEKIGQKEAPAKESQGAKEVKEDKSEVEQQRRSRRTRRGSRAGGQVAEKAPEKAQEQSRPKAESTVEPKAEFKAESEAAPEHSGESQGARRGRRRVVRSNETGHQDEPRRDHSGARDARDDRRSHGAGSAGDVAAIAAEAVQHAGIEDPDEPTGADYVPNEPQEIAATPASAPEVAPEAGTDRRGRRRVRRVVRPTEGHAPERKAAQQKSRPKNGTTQSDRKQEPKAAPESAAESAAASPTGTPSTGQSFAEARAEFDASPRRRRRTRGRSRSDVAPQPVDFADAGSTAEAASSPERVEKSQPEVESSAPTSKAPKKSQDTAVTSDAPAARRGRRRVVRSSR